MTRRDYEGLARAIRKARDGADEDNADELLGSELCARFIADHCAATNKRFDRERFLKDCGIN